jgi:cytoskeletal protein RodZ
VKPDAVGAEADSGIDDPRTSAPQAIVDGGRPDQTGRPPRKRPISLAMLVAIALIFLVLGGVAAVVFGNIRDDSKDEPSPTTAAPTVTATLRTSVTPTTSAQPTTTRPAPTTTAATEPPATEPPTSTATTSSAVSSPATTAAG